MRALRLESDGSVGLGDVKPRPLVAGLVRVKVTATGVCGTDLHLAAGEYAHEAPVTMGHEISGTVVEVGSPEDAHWHGRDVVCETYFSTCESCTSCRDGRRNLCVERRSLGSFEDGGFAEYVVVPVQNLHAAPEGVDRVDLVLTEPLACVVQCLLDPSRVQAGDRVLVIGPGTMGLLAVQVAIASGGDVTCSGRESDAVRLALAATFGATVTTDVADDAYDVVIECSGSAGGLRDAYRAAARGGRVVQVGIVGRVAEIPVDLVLYKELELSSGFASTARSWRRALALLESGAIRFDSMVSHSVEIAQWREAFDLVGAPGALKVAIRP